MKQSRILCLMASIFFIMIFFASLRAAHAESPQCLPQDETCQFEVDTDFDDFINAFDFNKGDGICKSLGGYCALRTAIDEASALKKPTKILLKEEYFVLEQGQLNVLPDAQITIQGQGADKTIIQGKSANRILKIGTKAKVDVIGLRLYNYNSSFYENGGVIYNESGSTLTVKDSYIYGGRSRSKVEKDQNNNNNIVFVGGAQGGSIFNDQGTVNVENTTFYSGIVTTSSPPFNWTDVERQQGQDLLNQNPPKGGVFYNKAGTINISQSTFNKNVANYSDFSQTPSFGGVIYNDNGKVSVVNSTFSNNSSKYGNVIYSIGGSDAQVYIVNSTLVGGPNTIIETSGEGAINLKSSIVSNGTIYPDPNPSSVCHGTIKSSGYNIISFISQAECPILDAPGDIIGSGPVIVNPLLGVLTEVSNTSSIHSVFTGSPAIDGGDPAGCSDFDGNLILEDQRGFPRPANAGEGRCDIGAVEVVCGDGVKQVLIEECDDGNEINGDGCDTNCTVSACGNGIQTEGEECDDGNNQDEDGCSSSCKLESPAVETPDDPQTGSTTGGDPTPNYSISSGASCSLQQIQNNYPAGLFWGTVLLSFCALGLRFRRKNSHR